MVIINEFTTTSTANQLQLVLRILVAELELGSLAMRRGLFDDDHE